MLEEEFQNFQKVLKGRWNNGTIEQYELWTKRFIKWIQETGIKSDHPRVLLEWDNILCDGIAPQPWKKYEDLKTYEYKYGTRLIALSAAKLFLNLGVGIKGSDLPKINKIIRGEEPEFRPDFLSIEQVEKLFESARKPQHEVMMKLGYNLIMRAKELLVVKKEDIDFHEETIYVHAAKESVSRTLTIDNLNNLGIKCEKTTIECLRELAEERTNYMFLTYDKVRPWKSDSWRAQFMNAYNCGWHAFARHSPIIHRLEIGQPFEEVWIRARHKHPAMTARYAVKVAREAPEYMRKESR